VSYEEPQELSEFHELEGICTQNDRIMAGQNQAGSEQRRPMCREIMIKSKIEIKKLCNGDHYFVAWGCRIAGSWNQILIFLALPGFIRLYQA